MLQIFPLHKVTFQKCQFENVLSFFKLSLHLRGRTLVYPKVLLCSLLGIYLSPTSVNRNLPDPDWFCGRQPVHEESLSGELNDHLFLKLSLLSLPTFLRDPNMIPKGPGIF